MTNFEYILNMKDNDFDFLALLLSDLIEEESRHQYSDTESDLEFIETWLNRDYLTDYLVWKLGKWSYCSRLRKFFKKGIVFFGTLSYIILYRDKWRNEEMKVIELMSRFIYKKCDISSRWNVKDVWY